MKKKLVIMGAILVLLGVSVSCLFVHQNEIRSEMEIVQGSAYDSGYESLVRVDDTNYWNNSIDSHIYALRDSDNGVTCRIDVGAAVNENNVYLPFDLHYEYISSVRSFIPQDAGEDRDNSPGVSRLYVDPTTGDSLQFRESGGIIESIRFTGTTVVGTEVDFRYAQFDLIISYRMDVTYVNSIETEKKGQPKQFVIEGEENGKTMAGSIHVQPRLNMFAPLDREVVSIDVSVEGTEIPEELLSYSTAVKIGSTYSVNMLTPYLRDDGLYIIPKVTYSASMTETGGLIFKMTGEITIYELDGSCDITSKKTIEFDFGVMG